MGGERRPLRVGYVLLLGYAIIVGWQAIRGVATWSDWRLGLISGAGNGVFVGGVVTLVIGVPWAIAIWFWFEKMGWSRWRTFILIVPALLVMAMGPLSFVNYLNTRTPPARFEQTTGCELPENLKNFRYHFSGGGFADYGDTYSFQTTPEEVDRLIREMELTGGGGEVEVCYWMEEDGGESGVLRGFPGVEGWESIEGHGWNDDHHHWYFELVHDETKTKVIIYLGCT